MKLPKTSVAQRRSIANHVGMALVTIGGWRLAGIPGLYLAVGCILLGAVALARLEDNVKQRRDIIRRR